MKTDSKFHHCKTNDEIANAVFLLYPDLEDDIPVAYVSNLWFFGGLPFYVDESVLVPRFDTEMVLFETIKTAKAKAFANKLSSMPKDLKILDLCTGSGCIAVCIAKHLEVQVTASDISNKSLDVARKNARKHAVNIDFVPSDLFENIDEQFDIIVSNPPYLCTNEVGKDDRSVLREPKIALDGGEDGLCVYRKIAEQSKKHLADSGVLVLEIGATQANDVKTILQDAGFGDINVVKDTMGKDRVIICRKN